MAVNTMTFEQSAAFLTSLYKEATGQEPTIKVADTGTFTTVATTLLQMGYDPIINAITQMIDRTIFSIRPYSGKFKSITVDELKWGSVTRKINYIDSDIDSTDNRLNLTDGQSIDPYVVKKPKVLQTNFYGNTVYSEHVTIFRDQLDSAFSSVSEFSRFIAGVLQNINDKMEQIAEAEARGIVANFITGKSLGDSSNVINVLQVYYDQTGVTLTPSNMFNVSNYEAFTRWFAGYLETLYTKMAQRSIKYHMNVTGSEIMRHTEKRFMKKLISDNVAAHIKSTVASNLYNPDKISGILDNSEEVAFWQNIEDPYKVSATPTYLNTTDGTLITAQSAETVDNIMAVIFDEEAMGMTRRSTWSAPSAFNPNGGYYNIFWHWTQSTWNDFSENGLVLYAGTVTP